MSPAKKGGMIHTKVTPFKMSHGNRCAGAQSQRRKSSGVATEGGGVRTEAGHGGGRRVATEGGGVRAKAGRGGGWCADTGGGRARIEVGRGGGLNTATGGGRVWVGTRHGEG
jgi:hypothetical protein